MTFSVLKDVLVLDAYWLEAWNAIRVNVRPRDCLLLPPGDWPCSAVASRRYERTIRIGNATILALHKGRLAAISKPMLRGLMKRWEIIFANEVFVCFRKPNSVLLHDRPHCDDPHVGLLHEYLLSHQRKRVEHTVWFAHLPKTAGTALWETLSKEVVSAIYYDSFETFLDRPPRRGEYDLVGGHIPLPLLMRMAGPEDIVTGLVRDPTARLRSAFMHSRRAMEDPATFTPLMRAMREQPLAEVLHTADGQMELRQQFLMLGFDFSTEYTPDRDQEIHNAAVDLLSDPRCRFDTTDHIDRLASELFSLLHIPPPEGPIGIRNASGPNVFVADQEEFDAAVPQILAQTGRDRLLHELVGSHAAWRGRAVPQF